MYVFVSRDYDATFTQLSKFYKMFSFSNVQKYILINYLATYFRKPRYRQYRRSILSQSKQRDQNKVIRHVQQRSTLVLCQYLMRQIHFVLQKRASQIQVIFHSAAVCVFLVLFNDGDQRVVLIVNFFYQSGTLSSSQPQNIIFMHCSHSKQNLTTSNPHLTFSQRVLK